MSSSPVDPVGPDTLEGLKAFYIQEYRPLYDMFASEGAMVQQLHTEIAAGVDHFLWNCDGSGGISREDCSKAAAHFKRATFDAFKILFCEKIQVPYLRLMDRKYIDVHDGALHAEITGKRNESLSIARDARRYETLSRNVDYACWHRAFEEWKRILPIAEYFSTLECSEAILRVNRNSRVDRAMGALKTAVWTIVGALLGCFFSRIL